MIAGVFELAFRSTRSISEKPSILGICISARMSWNGCPLSRAACKAANADSPSDASAGCMPQFVSRPSRMRRLVRLSSTTSTLVPCNTPCSAGTLDPVLATSAPRSRSTVRWNAEPLPTSLSTQMRPHINPTKRRQMVRPRPVPPYSRVVDVSA